MGCVSSYPAIGHGPLNKDSRGLWIGPIMTVILVDCVDGDSSSCQYPPPPLKPSGCYTGSRAHTFYIIDDV